MKLVITPPLHFSITPVKNDSFITEEESKETMALEENTHSVRNAQEKNNTEQFAQFSECMENLQWLEPRVPSHINSQLLGDNDEYRDYWERSEMDSVCMCCEKPICSKCGYSFVHEDEFRAHVNDEQDDCCLSSYTKDHDSKCSLNEVSCRKHNDELSWRTAHSMKAEMSPYHNAEATKKDNLWKPKKLYRKKHADTNLTFEQLAKHFYLPRKEAAKRLGTCVTILKRRCRQLGILCWPFRKMRCLDERIRLLLAKTQESPEMLACIHHQILQLKQRRKSLVENPNISLQELLTDYDAEDKISLSSASQ